MDKSQPEINLDCVIEFVLEKAKRWTKDEIKEYIKSNLYRFTKG